VAVVILPQQISPEVADSRIRGIYHIRTVTPLYKVVPLVAVTVHLGGGCHDYIVVPVVVVVVATSPELVDVVAMVVLAQVVAVVDLA